MQSKLRSDFLALVVEDDPRFGRLIEQALADLGPDWQAVLASTGGQALEMIANEGAPWVDLILVDLGLPDIHGVRVIEAARRRWPQAPILVASVHRSSHDVLAAIKAGARGYVDKSDTALTLADAIRQVLGGEYPISASLARHLFRLVPGQQASGGMRNDEVLSPRELELLKLLGESYTYEEASERMGVSLSTVQTFSRRIFQKLEVHSKLQAVTEAQARGWL